MIDLPTVWFVAIAVLWFGFLLLECFDMGVGMHFFVIARTPTQRRVLLNTIGPVWDGNEVWLVTAGAAMFAAFPNWYASLLSGMYLPIVALLLALIVRAVAIEYRSKHHAAGWTRTWDAAIASASLVAAFAVGLLLGTTTGGLPIDANGDRVGGPLAWASWQGLVGGLAVVGFSLVHGATFLALKSRGDVRERARRFAARFAPVLVLPLAAWVLVVQLRDGSPATWALAIGAVAALAAFVAFTVRRREGRAFVAIAAFLAAGVASIFAAVFPAVLPSTIDPAFTLDVWNASSGDYTLGIMSIVMLFGLPAVIAAQAWSYWTFRRRLAERNIPPLHEVVPALR
ncbi:MAG: cytochrome d ubiquinol oxidase subunit II, partial [Pseudoclavibacter sp.]